MLATTTRATQYYARILLLLLTALPPPEGEGRGIAPSRHGPRRAPIRAPTSEHMQIHADADALAVTSPARINNK